MFMRRAAPNRKQNGQLPEMQERLQDRVASRLRTRTTTMQRTGQAATDDGGLNNGVATELGRLSKAWSLLADLFLAPWLRERYFFHPCRESGELGSRANTHSGSVDFARDNNRFGENCGRA
jgi:hypothetical protein